jgi:hypothetical protein
LISDWFCVLEFISLESINWDENFA